MKDISINELSIVILVVLIIYIIGRLSGWW